MAAGRLGRNGPPGADSAGSAEMIQAGPSGWEDKPESDDS